MGKMTLYNRDSNGFCLPIGLGGYPLFSDDIVDIQNNTLFQGVTSLLRGWSCVLSGCLVDTLNTSTNTLSMTDGLILINDVVYYVPAMTGQTYPFSFVPGTQTIDSRSFLDGSVQDVAINYDFAIKTSFSFVGTSAWPTNIGTDEIYFDPFTNQRSEVILNNISKGIGEKLITDSLFLNIAKTETGNNIIGGSLSAINNYSGTPVMRWKYYGYSLDSNQYVLRSNGSSTSLLTGGADAIVLNTLNIPAHVHGAGTLTAIAGIENNHQHTIKQGNNTSNTGGAELTMGNIFSPGKATAQNISGFEGQHTHLISGTTDGGVSLPAVPVAINNLPNYKSSYFLNWKGYQAFSYSFNNGYQSYSRPIKYSNM